MLCSEGPIPAGTDTQPSFSQRKKDAQKPQQELSCRKYVLVLLNQDDNLTLNEIFQISGTLTNFTLHQLNTWFYIDVDCFYSYRVKLEIISSFVSG